jgi:trigger factor
VSPDEQISLNYYLLEKSMQVSVETTQDLERKMTVRLPAEQLDQQVKERLQGLRGKAKIDGFRPGKVPFSVIEKRFGEGVRQEVIGDLIQKNYVKALEEQKLNPASMPEVDFAEHPEEKEVSFTAVFEVMPEIELSRLTEISVQRPKVAITDQDIDKVIERLRKQRAEWKAVERAAKESDMVTIDFVGRIDGEEFAGGSAQDHKLVLGEGQMLEDFEKAVLGASAGEVKTFSMDFPEDYFAPAVAGKKAEFEVTVKSVEEAILPEVDDEFAKAVGVPEEGGVSQLREDIRANLESESNKVIQGRLKTQVMTQIPEVSPVDVPKAMVEREVKRLQQIKEQRENDQRQTGGPDIPDDEEALKAMSVKNVMTALHVQEVIARQEMKADEMKVHEMVWNIASGYPDPSQIIDFYLKNPQLKQNFESAVLEDQVVEWVVSQAKVEETEVAFEDLMSGKA